MLNRLEGLYAITDEVLTPDETVVQQIETALESGIGIVQYRNKNATDAQIKTVCIQLQELCTKHHALFIIDDRPQLAYEIKADGIHIGKNDMNIKEARAVYPEGIIGVSCYGSIRLAKEAQEEGADYVAFGSFFQSPTKPHSGIISMNVLEKARKALTIPICAIGGINTSNIHEVSAKKPHMISVVSAVFHGDIKKNINHLKQGMNV